MLLLFNKLCELMVWLGMLDVFYNVPVLIWFLSPSNGHSRDSRKHLFKLSVRIGNCGKGRELVRWMDVSSAAVCRLSNCHMLVARWPKKKTQVQLQYISWNFNYQLRLEADSEALRKILSNNTRQTNKYKCANGEMFIKNVTVFKIWFCLCLNNINYLI